MSSSSTSSATSVSYTHPLAGPDQMSTKYNIGKQIISTHSTNGEHADGGRSIKGKGTASASPSDFSPQAHSLEDPSLPSPEARRPSIPTIHLRGAFDDSSPPTSSQWKTSPVSPSSSSKSSSSPGDLYNNLSSFKFGSTQSPTHDTDVESEHISPLMPFNNVSDRTPRPSVSIPVRGRNCSYPSKHESSPIGPSRRPRPPGKTRAGARRGTLGGSPISPQSPPLGGKKRGSSGSDPLSDVEASRSPIGPVEEDDPMSDRASLCTFGKNTSMTGSSAASLSSSRASSRVGFQNTEFSSDDESEYPFDELGDAPVVFARDVHSVEDEYLVPSGPSTNEDIGLSAGRRGSLPISIPGSVPDRPSVLVTGDPGRDREDSLATLRRPSRSLDDELRSFAALRATQEPNSEPLSRGDWKSLEEKQREKGKQKQLDDDEPSISEDDGNVYEGLDMSYILGGSPWGSQFQRRASDTPSYIQSPTKSATLGIWTVGGGRRPSTATLGTISSANDDSFDKYVKRWDTVYAGDVAEWSFKKEKADGTGAVFSPGGLVRRSSEMSGRHVRGQALNGGSREQEKVRPRKTMTPGMQEIWRNEMVGRFKVDRQEVTPSDTTKPPQQRLSIRHIIDPYNKGNVRGGPGLMVHKHSRAVAFSLYRAYHMYISSQRDPGYMASKGYSYGTTGKRSAANVLLAPKHVQQEYTNTKSVGNLQAHGLLDDNHGARATEARRRPSTASRRTKEIEREYKQERERMKEEEKRKKREKDEEKRKEKVGRAKGKKGTESQTSSTGSMSGDAWNYSSNTPPPVPPKDSEPFVPPVEHTYPPQPPNLQRHLSNKKVARPPTASTLNDPSTVDDLREDDVDIDLDGHRPTRTPHSEAFDTLDPNVIEYVRNRPEHRNIQPESGNSLTSRMTRLWLGPKRSSNLALGSTSVSREGSFRPPWMTLAERSQVESQERVVQNVSTSFKDVGLLPTGRPSHRRAEKASNKRLNRDIFNQVPDDSLYMLLPLWPGETDPASVIDIDLPFPPLEDRTYLLVYYVPFLEKRTKSKHVSGKNKRSLTPPPEPGAQEGTGVHGLYLSSFRVDARLVGYEEVRGSGIRLPSEGLAVTGPMTEALASCPTAFTRAENHHDVVIAKCFNRDKGFEFDRNGLEKLGLCASVSGNDYETETECEPEEAQVLLSPIGRAVVEMAWLGGMALTSFG